MKGSIKLEAILIGITLVLFLGIFSYVGITAYAINDFDNSMMGPPSMDGNGGLLSSSSYKDSPQGPSAKDIECMQSCVSVVCESGDKECMMANSKECGTKCGVDVDGPPEPADENEACMQKCIVVGCDEYDFSCQNKNMDNCEEECNMKGDAPDESEMSEEQKCITECVMEKDPSLICGNSKEGETGGRLCKKCAKKCEYLYEGPCLNDDQIKEKEKECETCKHCYGEPIEGPSGEGWNCIINIECKDASSEFGDEAGEGPGIGQEGYVNKESLTERIGGFFKGLFSGDKEKNVELEEKIQTPEEI